jgi:hypothetical protein
LAKGHWLLFLHADTMPPIHAAARIKAAAQAGHAWGRFDVALDGAHPALRLVSALMNLRSRWSGIATGDQAIFLRRDVFESVGRYPDQPLMEDIELSTRLKSLRNQIGPPGMFAAAGDHIRPAMGKKGVWRTIFLMWRLRWRYWRGEPPSSLADDYR